MKTLISYLKETWSEWGKDNGEQQAAALAFYITFSLGPLLVVLTAVAGVFLSRGSVQNQIVDQIQHLVGQKGADAIRAILTGVRTSSGGTIAAVLGVLTLLLGAGGVFGHLQQALNSVWGVRRRPGGGFLRQIRVRLLSVAMVFGAGFLLLVTLVVNAALAAVTAYFHHLLPGADAGWQAAYYVALVAVSSLIFGLIFHVLPDVRVRWRSVAIGAVATGVLFALGQVAIGFYLGRGSFASAYGAAGSFVVLFMWIYYSCQILLLGAEFTQVFSRRHGIPIEPDRDAESLWETAPETGQPHKRPTAA